MPCAKCHIVFSPKEVFVHVDGCDYHQGCARCSNCSGRIDQRFNRGERGEILCVPCGTPICSRCNQGISGIEVLKAQGKSFHLECFTCSVCCARLQNKYYGNATQPKCINCELPQCGLCRTTIGAGTRYYVLPDGRSMCLACQSSNMNYVPSTQSLQPPTPAGYAQGPPPPAVPITVATKLPSPPTTWVHVTADVQRPVHNIPAHMFPVELPRTPSPIVRQAVTEPWLGTPRTKVTPAAQMPTPPSTTNAYPQSG